MEKISNLKHLEELTFKCAGGDRQIVRIADDFYVYKQNVFTKKWECFAKYDNGWDAYVTSVKPHLVETVDYDTLRKAATDSLSNTVKTLKYCESELSHYDPDLKRLQHMIEGKKELLIQVFGFSEEEFDSLERSIQE